MGINSLTRWGFLAAALILVFEVRATTIKVDIDTGALGIAGQNWDLAFDLINVNPASNSVSISSFSVVGAGGLTCAPPYPLVTPTNVTGSLCTPPGIATLDDTVSDPNLAFIEYLDNADIGTGLSFVLELSEGQTSGFDPDTFALFFLAAGTNDTLPTGDPTGANALLVYAIGSAGQPTAYCLTPAGSPIDCVTVTPVVLAAPEPGVLALAIAALLALGLARSASRRASPLQALGG